MAECRNALQLLVAQAGHGQCPDRGKKDLAIAIHGDARIQIDLSPNVNEQFIARPEHVICRDRNAVKRREGRGNLVEQLSAEDLQRMAGLVFGKDLKLCSRGNGANRVYRAAGTFVAGVGATADGSVPTPAVVPGG